MNLNRKSGSGRRDGAAGEGRKSDAHDLLETRRTNYIRRGRPALLLAMLAVNGTATADDVQAAVELASGIDPRCLGSVPGRLAYDKIIEPAGFTRSTRPERHAGWLQVWRLIDRAAAERWLREHPDLPDPAPAEDQAAERQRVLFDTQEAATPTVGAAGAAT